LGHTVAELVTFSDAFSNALQDWKDRLVDMGEVKNGSDG
jgi:hypothetical protein